MTNQERFDHLRWLDVTIAYCQDMAHWHRATSWLHGTGHAAAHFYTKKADRLCGLYTETCKRWGLTDKRLSAEFNQPLNP